MADDTEEAIFESFSPELIEKLKTLFPEAPEGPFWDDKTLGGFLRMPEGSIQSQNHYKRGWLRRCAVKFGPRTRRYHKWTVLAELAKRIQEPTL